MALCISFRNTRVKAAFIGVIFLLAFSPQLKAQFNGDFEIHRHYLETENFLDWKAYQMPVSHRYDWHLSKNAFRVSTGSIDLYRFNHSVEIKLSKEIGRYFSVAFEQNEDSFDRQDPIYQEAELRFGSDLGVSIIGIPQHEKKLSHTGYAFSYAKKYDPTYLKISYLAQYKIYNWRNVPTDKNIQDRQYDQIPILLGIDGQTYRKDKFFLKLNLKRVSPAEFRIFSASGGPNAILELDTYSGYDVDLIFDWLGFKDNIIGLTVKSKNDTRTQKFYDSSPQVTLEQSLDLNWLDLYYSWKTQDNDRFTVGYLDSAYKNDIGASSQDREYLCHLATRQIYGQWEYPLNDWFTWLFSLQYGRVRLEKQFQGMTESPIVYSTEIKAGVGFLLAESGSYRFVFNTTYDLDLFTERQWDGGNVQLQYFF